MLGVEAVGTDERTVLIGRQSSGDGLGGEVVSEAGEEVEVEDIAGGGICTSTPVIHVAWCEPIVCIVSYLYGNAICRQRSREAAT